MAKSKYNYTELGMLLGISVGGGLAIILFATTGEAIYLAIVGIGLALGLSLGAAFEKTKRSRKARRENGTKEDK